MSVRKRGANNRLDPTSGTLSRPSAAQPERYEHDADR